MPESSRKKIPLIARFSLARTCLPLLALCALALAQSGARYLIIAHDNFYDAVQPLAAWKQQKGMMCRVVKLSEIGSSNTQIRNYVLNAYNTWNPRPEFLLLVGSGYYIPAYSYGHSQDLMFTDNPFANVTGDFQAELPYGRLPCKTARQCSVMVAKTLTYERTPDVSDTGWFRRATGVIADSGDADGPTYWADVRYVAGLAGAAGYVALDSLASSRHDNTTDVISSVNNGTSFVLYRGEAGVNWISPFQVNPGSTANGNKLPIICSFTCQTEALNRYDTMIGDAWLKAGTPQTLKGAVAFIGNTHNASHVAAVRSAMTRGYFDAFFSDTTYCLGSAVLQGKRRIWTQFHDSIETMGFNLLGDPELNFWTAVPRPLSAAYDTLIGLGPLSYPVQITDAAGPVANALVCICEGTRIYQYGYTDGTGQVSFDIDPDSAGTLNVTATAHNHLPYEGTARIVNQLAVRAPLPLAPPLEPLLSVSPSASRGRFRITCSANAVVGIYAATGRLVATLETEDSRHRGHDAESGFASSATLIWDAGHLPAGVYVVRAVWDGAGTESRIVQLLR